jgi:putative mycofactocin binding protein MftB
MACAVSTEVSHVAVAAPGPELDPARPWRLSPSVALRDESFGALAYDFTTRRLSFLKSRLLVDVVRGLESVPDVGSALEVAGVPEGDRATYLRALDGLARSGMLTPR